ncbi:MAG: hypothetical protein HYV09_30220 [Deltaproteobacteria bacterium]|nr:hypothetical protein [Deltaproteobacteria bacterium]
MQLDRRALIAPATLCLLLGYTACGADSAGSSDFAPGAPGGAADAGTGGGGYADTGAVDTAPPPEREVESSYESPVATGRYVWIANPKSGRVAYIDATTLAVNVVEAGNAPTYLAAVPSPPDQDVAITLNVLSDDATLLRKTSAGLTAKTFSTHHGANAWKLSADGRWAIAWTDAKGVKSAGKTEGFQDLTVVDLTEKVPPTVLAVGYRPVTVGFTRDAKSAWAVTQDGITIISLEGTGLEGSGPLVTKNVPIADKPLEDTGTRDVSVTPDGTWALIRRDGEKNIGLVSLLTGSRVTVTLSGPVTDLDLSEDGSRAVAVVRDTSEVAILPLPGITTKPDTFTVVPITGETIGSVSIAKTGTTAVLYTNAVPTERFTVLKLGSGTEAPSFQVQKLYSPVLAVFPTDDAKNAVVLHEKSKTDTSTRAAAFSVVPIAAGLPAKIVGTDAFPMAVALAPTSDRAVITERDDTRKIYGAFLAKMPSLAVERYPLASPPIAVGIVAGAKRAYVAQEHPEGRITFIDLDGGTARTLTGFELSARVVDGSKP